MAFLKMKIDLVAARTAPKELRASLPPESTDIGPDAEIIENVDFLGSLWRDSRGPHISGQFTTKVRLECARCLGPAEIAIEGTFDDTFVEEKSTAPGEFEIRDGLLDESFAGDSVELTEVLREQILLELPEQVFCREDCRGLCPKCGQNRNLVDCNDSEDFDPRWAALKDLN